MKKLLRLPFLAAFLFNGLIAIAQSAGGIGGGYFPDGTHTFTSWQPIHDIAGKYWPNLLYRTRRYYDTMDQRRQKYEWEVQFKNTYSQKISFMIGFGEQGSHSPASMQMFDGTTYLFTDYTVSVCDPNNRDYDAMPTDFIPGIFLNSHDEMEIFLKQVAFGDKPAPEDNSGNAPAPAAASPPSPPPFENQNPATPAPEQVQATVSQMFSAARTAFNQKDYDAVIADATKALELNPYNVEGYNWLADAKRMKSDWAGAVAAYDKSIALKSDNANAYFYRGLARSNLGDYDGEIADNAQAIQLNPTSNEYNNRADGKRHKNDYDGAICDFDQAIQLDAHNGYAYVGRGLSKQAKGDLDGAIADYYLAIEKQADFDLAKQSLEAALKAKAQNGTASQSAGQQNNQIGEVVVTDISPMAGQQSGGVELYLATFRFSDLNLTFPDERVGDRLWIKGSEYQVTEVSQNRLGLQNTATKEVKYSYLRKN